MVIYNQREIASKFVKDCRIVEINSPIADISEAIEIIREEVSKETPDLSQFSIHSYRYSNEEFEPYTSDAKHLMNSSINVFDELLSESMAESLSDSAAIYNRPEEFIEFEKEQFNQKTNYSFLDEEIEPKEVLNEMLGAYGILPTLWNVDKPIRELKALSTAGEKLIRMYPGEKYKISKFNGIPNLEAIEFYQNLTPYEKRIISDGRVHPAKVFQIAKFLKENGRDVLLTKDMLTYLISETEKVKKEDVKARVNSKQVVQAFTKDFAKNNKDLLEKASEVFKDKYHGFVPRVINEYMQGVLSARGYMKDMFNVSSSANISTEVLEEIADSFNRQNVSKVAKYKNPVLLALSEKVDFGKLKDNVIQTLGCEVSISDLKLLFGKGFPEWLNNHVDATPAEIVRIIDKIADVNKIDATMNAKDLIAIIENKKGYDDCKQFEQKEIYRGIGYKFANNELAIKGRHIVAKQGNLTMRMLAPDDYKNFTIGIDTHCCQRYGDAGESCVYKYTSDPFAGAVVIERGNKVIAQGFVWVDVMTDTFVFDNVELDNDREVQQFTGLFAAYAKALPYANVHIGTGYNQGMNGWGQKVLFDKKNPIVATMPTTIDGRTNITGWGNGNCYSDYHVSGSVARVIKHMGDLKLRESPDVRVEFAPDEPTRWDELAKPDLCFMLNDWHKTVEERIDAAKRFRENPSEEMQMEIIRRTPAAIASLENPCEAVQKYILENNPELIWSIKNPCTTVQVELIKQDPSYISSVENPSDEMVIDVLSRDGLMLEHISNPSVEACLTAVRQNGYARKFVPEGLVNEEIDLASVSSQPKVIANIQNPSNAVIRVALNQNPNVISIMAEPSVQAQLAAVRIRPAVINQIENPCYEAVSEAVSRNGLMIRNFQKQYPELREVALRQNGFAAGCLKDLTIEEARIALNQNSHASIAIKNADILNALVHSNPSSQENIFDVSEIEIS